MNKNEIIEKLNALSENQEFADRVAMAATEEDAAAVLRAYGVDVTVDQLYELMAVVPEYEDGTLSEEALEDISGGGLFSFFKRLWDRGQKRGEQQFRDYWNSVH